MRSSLKHLPAYGQLGLDEISKNRHLCFNYQKFLQVDCERILEVEGKKLSRVAITNIRQLNVYKTADIFVLQAKPTIGYQRSFIKVFYTLAKAQQKEAEIKAARADIYYQQLPINAKRKNK